MMEQSIAQFCQKRHHEIVRDCSRRKRNKGILPNGADSSIGAEQRAQASLAFLQERFVSPVKAVNIAGPGRIGQDQPAANRSDVHIRKPADQIPHRRRVGPCIGIGKQNNLAAQLLNRGIERGRFALAIRIIQHAHPPAIPACDFNRAVVARVGRNDNLQVDPLDNLTLVRWRSFVRSPPLRCVRRSAGRPSANSNRKHPVASVDGQTARKAENQRGINRVGIAHSDNTHPENDLARHFHDYLCRQPDGLRLCNKPCRNADGSAALWYILNHYSIGADARFVANFYISNDFAPAPMKTSSPIVGLIRCSAPIVT